MGRRLALIALANSYGRNVSFVGPVCKDYVIKGNKVELYYEQPQDELQVKGTTLRGFTIAGPDHLFYPATAIIQEGRIIVSSPQVTIPLAVRYGWADNSDCNLYGENGLPAIPFRTDNW